jgi:hypothetical protein
MTMAEGHVQSQNHAFGSGSKLVVLPSEKAVSLRLLFEENKDFVFPKLPKRRNQLFELIQGFTYGEQTLLKLRCETLQAVTP